MEEHENKEEEEEEKEEEGQTIVCGEECSVWPQSEKERIMQCRRSTTVAILMQRRRTTTVARIMQCRRKNHAVQTHNNTPSGKRVRQRDETNHFPCALEKPDLLARDGQK